MNSFFNESPVRVPVRLVDGEWEYFYGGGLPINDGSICTLLVDKHSIYDRDFIASLKRKSVHKILEENTELLVALTVKSDSKLDDDLVEHLVSEDGREIRLGWQGVKKQLSAETQFVKVRVGGPTERQMKLHPGEGGGVWIRLVGMEPKGLVSSNVLVPEAVSSQKADSLNHAFTLLSEKYEPWRKSHTGNIYDRVLFKEKNGYWYPLDIARNAAIAKDEHQYIREWWESITNQLGLQSQKNR